MVGPDREWSARPPRAVVVVPCFNHGRFVADAVRSALAQADAETRVVVVNDGSTDETSAAACDACARVTPDAPRRVAVVHQENRGLPAARNAGVAAASSRGWIAGTGEGGWGEYVTFLDADDYIEPMFVARLAGAIRDAERAGASEQDGPDEPSAWVDRPISHAYCQERLVDKAFGVWNVPDWDPDLLLVTNLHPITALVRAEWFHRASGFDESMRDGYEDWEFWIRLASKGARGVRVREPLFNWRRHSDITMVIEAVARHDALFGFIVRKHETLYAGRAMELIRRSNSLLRRGDGNWIDENLDAIVVRDLREANIGLWQDICKAREERDRLVAELDALRSPPASASPGPTVVTSTRLRRVLDSMGPVGRAVRGAAKAASRVLS